MISSLKFNKIDDNLISYQESPPTQGNKHCLLGLLKPVIDTDGTIYPCCNTQFAINSKEDWIKEMSLGTIKEIDKLHNDQKVIDGSVCKRCFSSHYNELLNLLLSDIKHENFI